MEEQDNTFKRNANQELVNRLGLKSKNEIQERFSGPLSHILVTLNKWKKKKALKNANFDPN